jgi:hypothetical protein
MVSLDEKKPNCFVQRLEETIAEYLQYRPRKVDRLVLIIP